MTGYGAKKNAGLYLSQLRDECTHRFGANQHQDDRLRTNITGCILETFTEYDKALFASRQYILTLWPAFVGAIVALAPDPASMIYDNIWWTGLFCITCGGLPGLDMASSPPHHVEVHSEVDGRAMCETWRYDSARPRALSRSRTMGSATRGAGHVRMEWIAYSIGIALWVAFIVFFGATLYGSATDFAFGGDWLAGAAWYYISASPAVLAACFELWHNRVDLYKPVDNVNTSDGSGATSNTLVVDSSVELQQHYERVKVASALSLWLRILLHQWRRERYRILVRDSTRHRYWWFFVIGGALVGILRMVVFALGSVTMGSILLMPVPDDLYLFVLLLFTTAVPRQLWPAFWANGNRGADLVVFVNDPNWTAQ